MLWQQWKTNTDDGREACRVGLSVPLRSVTKFIEDGEPKCALWPLPGYSSQTGWGIGASLVHNGPWSKVLILSLGFLICEVELSLLAAEL